MAWSTRLPCGTSRRYRRDRSSIGPGRRTNRSVRIHFFPERSAEGHPLAQRHLPERQREFRDLVRRAALEHPDAAWLRGRSWLYSHRGVPAHLPRRLHRRPGASRTRSAVPGLLGPAARRRMADSHRRCFGPSARRRARVDDGRAGGSVPVMRCSSHASRSARWWRKRRWKTDERREADSMRAIIARGWRSRGSFARRDGGPACRSANWPPRRRCPQATVGRIEAGSVSPSRGHGGPAARGRSGHELAAEPRLGIGVDRTLIRDRLRLTPAQRIRSRGRGGPRDARHPDSPMSEARFDPVHILSPPSGSRRSVRR